MLEAKTEPLNAEIDRRRTSAPHRVPHDVHDMYLRGPVPDRDSANPALSASLQLPAGAGAGARIALRRLGSIWVRGNKENYGEEKIQVRHRYDSGKQHSG